MIQLLLHDSWSLLDDFLQFLQVGRLSCNVALSAAYLYHYFFLEPTHNFLGNSMGYFMSWGAKLKYSNHAITLIHVDICPQLFPLKGTKPEEKRQPKSFTFSSLLLYMEEKWTNFVDSGERDVKKQISNAASQNTKTSTKFAVHMQYEN